MIINNPQLQILEKGFLDIDVPPTLDLFEAIKHHNGNKKLCFISLYIYPLYFKCKTNRFAYNTFIIFILLVFFLLYKHILFSFI
jgi:hypothetical protein